jgi:hypothetical protein
MFLLLGDKICYRFKNHTLLSILQILQKFLGLVYCYYIIVMCPFSPIYILKQNLSQYVSQLFASGLRFNPTALGIDITVFSLILITLFAIYQQGKKISRVFKWIIAFIMITSLQLVFVKICSFVPASYWNFPYAPSEVDIDTTIIYKPMIYFSMHDITFLLAVLNVFMVILFCLPILNNTTVINPKKLTTFLLCIQVILIFATSCTFHPLPQGERLDGLRIGIYCPWDKTVPQHSPNSNYGTGSTGMYGVFLDDIKKRGASLVEITETDSKYNYLPPSQLNSASDNDTQKISDMNHFFINSQYDLQNLTKLDALVIIVRSKPYSILDRQRIKLFLENGGLVIIAGDHTNLCECQMPFNQICHQYGIDIQFDSAFSPSPWWFRNIRANPLMGFSQGSWLDFGVGTGASLKIKYPAMTLLDGPYGFGDIGNILKNSMKDAYLGDYTYQHGEILGDIVLAASCKVGKGRILAFGDTTMFQNISYSHSGRFIRHLIAANISSQTVWKNSWGYLCMVIVVGGLLLSVIKDSLIIVLCNCVPCLFWICCIILSFSQKQVEIPSNNIVICDNMSLINREPFAVHTYQGLPLNIMRAGFLCEFDYSLEHTLLKTPQALFLIEPSKVLSTRQCRCLDTYMKNGGTVVVCAGYELAANVSSFLSRYSIKIDNTPLGGEAFDGMINKDKIAFLNSWAISFSSSQTQIIQERLGFPVIVYHPIGEGGLLLIGDSRFFADKNLESEKSYRLPNIKFLSNLLQIIIKDRNLNVSK